MNTRIFDAFESREQQVKDYVAGCGMKYGMDCTCGPGCRCQNCPTHPNNGSNTNNSDNRSTSSQPPQQENEISADMFETPLAVDQNMNFFGMEPPAASRAPAIPMAATQQQQHHQPQPMHQQQHLQPVEAAAAAYRAQRNPSVISYGNSGFRQMSLTSETTFGRAMSGLSALSIDWENLDDFDVEVDHSAHINNGGGPNNREPGARRSSLRRSFMAVEQPPQLPEGAHVTFKE